jgi:hypothetical protein
MDNRVFNEHLKIMRKIEERYRDRSQYPEGIYSENADILDKDNYFSAQFYIALCCHFKAVERGNREKAKQLIGEVGEAHRLLKECDEKIGFETQSHGLEHIFDICGLNSGSL